MALLTGQLCAAKQTWSGIDGQLGQLGQNDLMPSKGYLHEQLDRLSSHGKGYFMGPCRFAIKSYVIEAHVKSSVE